MLGHIDRHVGANWWGCRASLMDMLGLIGGDLSSLAFLTGILGLFDEDIEAD